jgi:hypothetical protein
LCLAAEGSKLFEGTSIAHTLRQGDVVRIKAAKNFTNGVSGTSSTILIGNVTAGKSRKKIPYEYDWGSQKIEKNAKSISIFTFETAN